MSNFEVAVGVVVTISQIGLLIYVMYKTWRHEERSPTETITPE